MPKYQIDETDQKILSFLVKNARMPFLEIARECGVSGAVHNSQTSRTSTMRQFQGSITRLGAGCLRFVPSLPSTTQDSLTAGG